MDDKQLRLRQRLKDDFEFYARNNLKIRVKEGGVVPFILNKSQKYLLEIRNKQKILTGKVRIIILKARQLGLSTEIQGFAYHTITHNKGYQGFIMTHESGATDNLFKMAKRFHENSIPELRPAIAKSNAKEMSFSALDSGYKLGTAGNKNTGRSATIQFLHCSEVAMWKNGGEIAAGLMEAVPNVSGTEVYLESTAKGVGNYFHQQWQLAEAGMSDFIPVFIPWFWDQTYIEPVPEDFSLLPEEKDLKNIYQLSDEQIMFRRLKIAKLRDGGANGEVKFKEEYPSTAAEAFQYSGDDSFIGADMVTYARKRKDVEPVGPLVIGFDPARFGNDRSSICWRKGRAVIQVKSHIKKSATELAGIMHMIIQEDKPAKVFMDACNLGCAIYDILIEIDNSYVQILTLVNAGSNALNQNKYKNKRAECWGEMREWLYESLVSIPDNDSLQSDLCGLTYKYTSVSQILLERKEDMRSRGLRSPDEGDAMALTFAMPVSAIVPKNYDEDEKARIITSVTRNLSKIRQSKIWQ